MLVKTSKEREWSSTDIDGIERCLFRNNNSGGRTSVVRLKKGSRFPTHDHRGTEEVLVLSGSVTIGGVAMDERDYMFTEPGEQHDVVAVSDAMIFVSSEKETPIVET